MKNSSKAWWEFDEAVTSRTLPTNEEACEFFVELASIRPARGGTTQPPAWFIS